MSDSITQCIQYVNVDGSINRYQVTFVFTENSSITLAVIVEASDLNNPTDLNEVKTKACALATNLKEAATSELELTQVSVTNLNGPVSL